MDGPERSDGGLVQRSGRESFVADAVLRGAALKSFKGAALPVEGKINPGVTNFISKFVIILS